MCEVRERTGWDWDQWLVVLTGRSLTLSHLSEYYPDELTSRVRDRISARPSAQEGDAELPFDAV